MKRFLQLLFACLALANASAQDFSVRAEVGSNSVTQGEPFEFQIQVAGSDTPEEPAISAIKDFTVTPLGSGSNSSSSVTIINGRVTQNVTKGFLFNYQLIPTKTGVLTIPPITVKEGTKTATTQPVPITVGAAQETNDFKLRMALPKTQVWVGEALTLDLTFYYKANLDQPQLSLPLASDPDFTVHDVEMQAANETAVLDGERYQIMKARRIVIPKRSGTFKLEPATLNFRGVTGYRVQQDLFFGRQQVPVMRNFAIPSNALDLVVRELPDQGKPPGFTGHVGSYQVSASASPVKVNVGDPITLTVNLSGPSFLQGVDLPPLQQQPELAKNFRLPAERSPGKIQGNSVQFTQTIRAARAEVTQIPPIELPYFDPEVGAYKVARSQPIPLEVTETRVVTAQDAEGTGPVTQATAEVEAWTSGIAYNYEDEDALQTQRFEPGRWFRSGGFWFLVLMPAAAYAGLLQFVRKTRAMQADPGGVREAQAAKTFQTRIATATTSDEVLDALRGYLGDRLRLSSGALTSKDLSEPLRKAGIAEGITAEAETLFRRCEASRYSGASAGNTADLIAASQQVVNAIEAALTAGTGGWIDRDLLKRIPGISRFLPLLAVLMVSSLSGAEPLNEAARKEIFREANALFRQANEQSAKDPQAAGQTYEKAILRFERLTREGGVENGMLYYNIGNAYFRTRDIGRAIVNYRRAQSLMPYDANVVQNLQFARSRRVDDIEIQAKRKVAEALFFWHHDLTPRTKAALFGWAVVIAWGAAAVRLFRPRPSLNWIAGTGAGLAILMVSSLAIDARAAATIREGVIVASEVIARKGDSETYEPSFKEPLHAGTEFRIREARAGWLQAELGDGRTCWLPEKAVERIW